MKRIAGIIVLAVIVLVAAAAWYRLTLNPVMKDPTTQDYAQWRRGKNPGFPKERINGYLNEDIDRDSLVNGLTLQQVQEKFFDVRTRERWTPYQQFCMKTYPPPVGEEAVFLSDDWWGIRFRDGRAIGFFLIKGC